MYTLHLCQREMAPLRALALRVEMELLGMHNIKDLRMGRKKLLELAFLAYQRCFDWHFDHVQILNKTHCKLNQLADIDANDPPSIIKIRDLTTDTFHWPAITAKINAIKRRFPNCKVGGLTAKQIAAHHINHKVAIKELLAKYRQCGLDFLLSDDLQFCEHPDFSFSAWIEVHRLAHQVGLSSELLLNLQKESELNEFLKLLPIINQLQIETKGFFIAEIDCQSLNFVIQVLICSLARVILNDLPDIGVSVSQENLLTGQLTMSFGANVLVRESREDDHEGLSVNELKTAIRKSKRKYLPYDINYHVSPAPPLDSIGLYKLQRTGVYDPEELSNFVASYPLPALGILTSTKISKKLGFSLEKFSCLNLPETPLTQEKIPVYIDFSNFDKSENINSEKLFNFVGTISQDRDCTLIGLHGIWQLSHKLSVPLSALFSKFAALGVKTVSSSEDESEENITTSEVIHIHRSAHEQGLFSIAKLEISAPYNGNDVPFWSQYIQRLLAFNDLSKETGMIKGIIVQESQSAFISLYEYLKAISITNIVSHNIPEVVAPIRTLSRGILQPKFVNKQSLLGLIPIILEFGATSIGLLNSDELEELAEDRRKLK